jgi:hypothetical protein
MTKIKQKATKLLRNLSFHKPTHNVSLVGPEVGGGANQAKVLILKQSIAPETVNVKKALEQVELKISMEEFLRKFFYVYGSDAEVLTKLLGFETEHEAYMNQRDESSDDYDWEQEHQKWIEERVSQFTIMKSLNEGSTEEISKSAFEEIVALQQKLTEPMLAYLETKEKQMNELELAKSALATKEAELATQVDVVKSLTAKVAELEAQVEVFKAAEEKAKFDAFAEQLKGLVADEKLETVAKGLYALHNVDAESAAATIAQMKEQAEIAKAAKKVAEEGLTQEQGHGDKQSQEDHLATIRKAAYAKALQQ